MTNPNLPGSSFLIFSPLKIYPGLLRLAAQDLRWQGILLAVLDEVGAALTKLKGHILPDALLPDVQNPVIIERAGVIIRLTADYHQLDTVQIFFYVDFFEKRLGSNTLVLNGQGLKYRQFPVRVLLIFDGAAHHHIVVSVAPVLGDALHEPFNPLGQKEEGAVLALLDHFPALGPPWVCFLNEKIRRKAGINQTAFHPVIPVL